MRENDAKRGARSSTNAEDAKDSRKPLYRVFYQAVHQDVRQAGPESSPLGNNSKESKQC